MKDTKEHTARPTSQRIMKFPSDKEFAQLQMAAEQRRLMRGGRGFLLFIRAALVAFLAVGVVALVWVCFGWVSGRPAEPSPNSMGQDATCRRYLYPVVFLTLWNLIVLAMIRLVTTQLVGAKRAEMAEQIGQSSFVEESTTRSSRSGVEE